MVDLSKDRQQAIKGVLENYPHLRNDDLKLIANIWFNEAKSAGLEINQVKAFLQLFSEGKLSHPETITRCRRKVQEENPHLQGQSYKGRKKKEQTIRETINQ